ncbi:hypothetical protein H109_06778 [Trichophyton interdigitale MR816]|uniref:Uncharacterized protein n=1 Tax=Trichophyton interdigitale (strain MR816) TaxID=1215338 RepID=A0A059J0V7_TRIIM|nr:hypothetical protein H109_06778 [Trichophyton interdigitale MR816]
MDETQPIARTYSVADIQSRRSLWYRLHVYVYDLYNFRTDRLDSVVDITYLGKPYFNQEEVELLKNTTSNTSGSKGETLAQKIESTLDERLNRRIKKRIESSDFRVCATHDLTPIFEAIFNIPPKKIAKNFVLVSLISSRGLRLRDEDDISCILGQTKLQALAAKHATGGKKKKKGSYFTPSQHFEATLIAEYLDDLLCTPEDKDKAARIETMLPYFSGETVTAIFNVFQGWPWKISLPETKQERGQSDGICASHDLSPLVEMAFR